MIPPSRRRRRDTEVLFAILTTGAETAIGLKITIGPTRKAQIVWGRQKYGRDASYEGEEDRMRLVSSCDIISEQA